MKRLIYRSATFSLLSSLVCASNLAAGQSTANFNVTIVIQANCTIAANNLAFGPQGAEHGGDIHLDADCHVHQHHAVYRR